MRHRLTVAVIECGLIGQSYGRTALFLASDSVSFVTGAALPVGGGASAG
ncbi:hypothetical protein [Altererythrobacter sp.]